VGFGSIAGRTPEQTTALVLEALRLSQQRGVLVGGWGGLRSNNLPLTVRFEESVPYSWLLPRVAAVVHHGGAGSTAEGLRAGKPTVVCPFFGDQPFWGRRVYELGAGPRPLPQKSLTPSALAKAIREAVTNEGMRARCSSLGEKIRAENGVQHAVQVVSEEFGRETGTGR
jgi:sterol 3beta-glucosyltransferase